MIRWDHETETGRPSPVRVEINENDIALLSATGPTPEEAITSALCLLEDAHRRAGRDDITSRAIAKAAEIMNDAMMLEGNT